MHYKKATILYMFKYLTEESKTAVIEKEVGDIIGDSLQAIQQMTLDNCANIYSSHSS
jgi:hypothetical protein